MPPDPPSTEHRYENGRRYHAFNEEEAAYKLPNDEPEVRRLNLQHHVWRLHLNDALYLSPISSPNPTVLDIGAGSGIWALSLAAHLPQSQVLGIDLSPIQPTSLPPNAKFLIANAEDPWTFSSQKFSFIHSRTILLGIRDWPRLIRQCWENLQPGGWLELQVLVEAVGFIFLLLTLHRFPVTLTIS